MATLQKIPTPYDSGILRALCNVNNACADNAGGFGPEVLITDLDYEAMSPPPRTVDYLSARAWLERKCPTALIGKYISSRLATDQPQDDGDPGRLPAAWFSESELLPLNFCFPAPMEDGHRMIDYRQPAVRLKAVRYIVDYAVRLRVPLIFADNWSHPATWPGYIGWKDTIAYMSQLRSALNARGILLVCNIAIGLNGVPLDDVQSLSRSCDGVSLEMHDYWTVDNLRAATRAHAMLVARGCQAILLPQSASESKALAALGLILSAYVTSLFYEPMPEWMFWPAKLGALMQLALGDVVTAQFERGTLSIDLKQRTMDVK